MAAVHPVRFCTNVHTHDVATDHHGEEYLMK